jgi:AcrR family transcriptional regulator
MPSLVKPFELPVIGVPAERADAARNRQRILAAAQKLFARDGVAATSMDAIALEAGVGKGTLFRRFGDRASLALALLESSERDFQESFIRGPCPLGPGAPPCERLIAFGQALLSHLAAHGDLLLAAQTAGSPGKRFDAGPYGAYRAHVIALIRDAAPDLDAEYTADAAWRSLASPPAGNPSHAASSPRHPPHPSSAPTLVARSLTGRGHRYSASRSMSIRQLTRSWSTNPTESRHSASRASMRHDGRLALVRRRLPRRPDK